MFRFWKREKAVKINQPEMLRCCSHQALLLWQWQPNKWVIGIDPEAPVCHQELLYTLDRVDQYGLTKCYYKSKRQAAHHIRQAYP